MTCYTHALILVNDKNDGPLLLNRAVTLAQPLGMKITLAHISVDYREMNYVSDSLMDDVVSEEVVKAKAFLSKLAHLYRRRWIRRRLSPCAALRTWRSASRTWAWTSLLPGTATVLWGF